MRIKIDIDNTIRDMGERMLALYNAAYSYETGKYMTKEDIFDYDVVKSFPLLKENGIDARDFFFNEHAEDIYSCSVPMKDSIKGIEKLREMGHEVILVSYQPTRDSQERTLDWLTKYKVPYDALVFTRKSDKTIIPADYIIDDNPAFLDIDSAKRVCIDWAYNRDKDYNYRVKSILEFANILEEGEKTQDLNSERFWKNMAKSLNIPYDLIGGGYNPKSETKEE